MVQLFIDGGGFMWPILIVFIFGFTFVGERIYDGGGGGFIMVVVVMGL